MPGKYREYCNTVNNWAVRVYPEVPINLMMIDAGTIAGSDFPICVSQRYFANYLFFLWRQYIEVTRKIPSGLEKMHYSSAGNKRGRTISVDTQIQ